MTLSSFLKLKLLFSKKLQMMPQWNPMILAHIYGISLYSKAKTTNSTPVLMTPMMA
jgi:hypothetical protein